MKYTKNMFIYMPKLAMTQKTSSVNRIISKVFI